MTYSSTSMETEKQKMLSGRLYNAMTEELIAERRNARLLMHDFNTLHPDETVSKEQVLRKLFGRVKGSLIIEPPFRCDYGYNIEIGESFFANFNLVILDCARVTIGDNVQIGPNVSIFTAGHPLHYETRNKGLEFALPVSIGDNVWIGGNVVINPGITIGANSVIGSGSIVTRNIPENTIAYGNPCRPIRQIRDEDKMI
jgi:maltose O-acetyltransferase